MVGERNQGNLPGFSHGHLGGWWWCTKTGNSGGRTSLGGKEVIICAVWKFQGKVLVEHPRGMSRWVLETVVRRGRR